MRTFSTFSSLCFFSRLSPKFQYLYGINPIELALSAGKRDIEVLIISDAQTVNTSYRITKIINLAQEKKVPIIFKSKDNMSSMVQGQPHQNAILKCSTLNAEMVSEPTKFDNGLYVFCDKITDPQNFGAIVRSCLFFGAKGVMISKKNSSPLNSTVSKASSGALELMPIFHIQRQEQFVKEWRNQQGLVLSTSVSSQTSTPITPQQCRGLLQKQSNKYKRILLVVGSEGWGVSPHLARNANLSICIDRTGPIDYPYSLVDSMNVNTALSCILYELTKKSTSLN